MLWQHGIIRREHAKNKPYDQIKKEATEKIVDVRIKFENWKPCSIAQPKKSWRMCEYHDKHDKPKTREEKLYSIKSVLIQLL